MESQTSPLSLSFVSRTIVSQVGLNTPFDVGIGEKCLAKWSKGNIGEILEVGVTWRSEREGKSGSRVSRCSKVVNSCSCVCFLKSG